MKLRMKEIREMQGLSQEEVADKLGVKTSRYGTWERQDRNMSLQQAYEVTEVLHCTLEELVGRSPKRVYADDRQARMNEDYELLDDDGRARAADAVRGVVLTSKEKSDADPLARPGPQDHIDVA